MSDPTLLVLASLSEGDKHGYAMMEDIERFTGLRLGPGTLYDNLQKLMKRQWVQELGRRPSDDDPRRRYYRLTPLGRGILTAETVRLTEVVREARSRLQMVNPRRA